MPTRPPPTDHVASKLATFHADIVDEVASAVASHDVVVVGMGLNPHVKRARRVLDEARVPHHDLDYGGYHSMWKERLALKMWSGWPTFPIVFAKGRLVGGADETHQLLQTRALHDLLDGDRPS